MAHLDFRLRHTQQSAAPASARVLLWFKGDLAELKAVGFRVSSVAGDVAAGSIPHDRLKELSEHPQVLLVEGSRQLKNETDTSLPAINLLDPKKMTRTVPGNGRGAIIGIIDSGFDLTHHCFRDARLRATRILCAWDQVNLRHDGGAPPEPFDYGVEYTRAQIDRMAQAGKLDIIQNADGNGGHGTGVAGVAAGNGARELIFKGVAPEADLIFVAYRNDVPIGGSAYVLDAIRYIVERARADGRPAVINLSQGDGLGAHDGTSLLERAIDYFVGHERVLVVNSAGNEGMGDHHARGRVAESSTLAVPYTLGPPPPDGDIIDLWYCRDDRFAVALKAPDGEESPFVRPDEEAEVVFKSGTRARLYSDTDYPANGRNRIGVIIEEGGERATGNWQLLLRGERVRCGHFDAWADRAGDVTSILFAEPVSACTVTLPGTAERIITVGGFVSRTIELIEGGAVWGELAQGSSRGPTCDGRHKPDLTAPGHLVMCPATRREETKEFPVYYPQRGTSVAAPHVAGVIALLWGLMPELSPEQLRSALLACAAEDDFTCGTPNSKWGNGKLDARAVYQALTKPAENGEETMSQEHIEFQMELQDGEDSDKYVPVTVRLEKDDKGGIGFRAHGSTPSAAKSELSDYKVSFVVRRKAEGFWSSAEGYYGCWVCLDPPCPPNFFRWMPRCPPPDETHDDAPNK